MNTRVQKPDKECFGKMAILLKPCYRCDEDTRTKCYNETFKEYLDEGELRD